VSPLSMWGTAYPPVRFTRRREREPQCTWARPGGQERCAGGLHRRDPTGVWRCHLLEGVPGPRGPRCEQDQKGALSTCESVFSTSRRGTRGEVVETCETPQRFAVLHSGAEPACRRRKSPDPDLQEPDWARRMVVSRIQAVKGVMRTLTCSVISLCAGAGCRRPRRRACSSCRSHPARRNARPRRRRT
jgi:hypothetical protein